jgi:DNA polymerase-3 subunit alpha
MAKIKAVKYVGEYNTYDLEVEHYDHQYYLANGILTSNSHACAYSSLTYAMAYLKEHYPTATFVAFMNSHSIIKRKKDERSKVPEYVADARWFKIKVLPPDINRSRLYAYIEDDHTVRLGIRNINGFRGQQKHLNEAIRRAPYRSVYDLMVRSGLDVGQVKSLILCGACDSIVSVREEAVAMVDVIQDLLIKYKQKVKRQKQNLEKYQPGGSYQLTKVSTGKKDDTAKKLEESKAKLEALEQTDVEAQIPEGIKYATMSVAEKARNEIALMGVALTVNPYLEALEKMDSNRQVCDRIDEITMGRVKVAGFVQGITRHITKKGAQMAFVWLQDDSGAIEATIFPKAYDTYGQMLEEGECYVMQGGVDENGDFYVDRIARFFD